MSQYDHGFMLFELGILTGQCTSSVERGVSTPHQASDFMAVQMRGMTLSHKEKQVIYDRIWKRLATAAEAYRLKVEGEERARAPYSEAGSPAL